MVKEENRVFQAKSSLAPQIEMLGQRIELWCQFHFGRPSREALFASAPPSKVFQESSTSVDLARRPG
jgi:hypothetical protein